jgi:shikimate 5-dehydrogenase
MTSKYIFAKQDEYKDFVFKSNRNNKIRGFFVSIINEMPIELKQEVRKSPTKLAETSRYKDSINGAREYSFITQDCSEELSNYLEGFAVFVEQDTKKITQWKQKISDLKFIIKDYKYSTKSSI